MKKILTITLLLITVLSINAQITRDILGLTLGKSSQQQVVKIMKDKGYYVEYIDDGIAVATDNGFIFGGITWQGLSIGFYKNILYMICLVKSNDTSSRLSDVYSTFELLKAKLNNKYLSYKNIDDEYHVTYNDPMTHISLSINESPNDMFLVLTYTDVNIFVTKLFEENDEL